jgi:hypothetical protein
MKTKANGSKQVGMTLVAGGLFLSLGGIAHAAAPAWCGGKTFQVSNVQSSFNLPRLDDQVKAIAKWSCATNADAEAARPTVDAKRRDMSQKLHMSEADWADGVAFIDNHDGNYPQIALSTKVLAQYTALDQYIAISKGVDQGNVKVDPLYVIDALDGQLSEWGRVAFVERCLEDGVDSQHAAAWAVCQADVDKLDQAKLAAQLRGDTAHDAGTKMVMRLRAYNLGERLAKAAQQRAQLFAQDAEYKKVFDVATQARAAWSKGVGADAELLGLVQAMDSATFAGSRKQMEGCEAKTEDALVKAVAAIPAKAFSGVGDDRDNPYKGFAYKAGPILLQSPAVSLAANAYAQCHKGSARAKFLSKALMSLPGYRGPRAAALGALLNTKFAFDDVNAPKLRFPDFASGRPYTNRESDAKSAGGVVASVSVQPDGAVVALKKTSIKIMRCVKSHFTGRVARITASGTIEYEEICDKEEPATLDTTWSDFKVAPSDAPMLKAGMKFSSTNGQKFDEVLAVWPTKDATTPSMVLGAKLK